MNSNEVASVDEFSAASLIPGASQERGTSTDSCNITKQHGTTSITQAIPLNDELKQQRSSPTSLSGTVISPTSPIKSDSLAPISGDLRTPQPESLIPSPPLSPGFNSLAAEIKIWGHDEELPLGQYYSTKQADFLRRSMSHTAGVHVEDRIPMEDRIRTADRILMEDCVRLEAHIRMEDRLEENIIGLGNGIRGSGLLADCARILGRNVLRPLKQTCKRSAHNGNEPMEPLVPSSFCTRLNASRVAKLASANIHTDMQGPFPTLSSQPYHEKSNPKATAKPPSVVPTRVGNIERVLVTPIDLRCISCGSVSTPCWRPSWSKGKLCNSCGLRYARNRVRCSNSSCSYIPTKTYISGHKRKKCKNCALDFIYQ